MQGEDEMRVHVERVIPAGADAADGAEDALVALMRRHEAALHRYVLVFSGSREIALDCVQETFVRAYEQLRRGRDVNTQWLYKVGRNAAIDELRRRGREGIDPAALEGIAIAASGEDMPSLLEAFAALAPEDRVILALVADGLSGEEMASRLGIRHGAVRMRLQRARERFRRLYEGDRR
jgi:RNA polymerase sigma factor (sigma-70 family)